MANREGVEDGTGWGGLCSTAEERRQEKAETARVARERAKDARIAELEQMVRCAYACCCGDCARKIEKVIPGIEQQHGQ